MEVDNAKMMKFLQKSIKDRHGSQKVTWSIGTTFYNPTDNTAVSICCQGKHGNTFYNKALVHQTLLSAQVNATSMFDKKAARYVTKMIETISDTKMRDEPHSLQGKWRRTGAKNNTTEFITMVLIVPMDEESDLPQLWASIAKKYMKLYAKKRTNNTAGEVALKYAESMGRATGTGVSGGLYGYLLKNKGDGDETKAIQTMNEELHNHWKGGIEFEHDVPLDKFLVDYDIKQFLQKYAGINSWDDLDEKGKRACYRDYPRRSLPDWHTIVEESY